MKINKDLAIKILKYQNQHKKFYFPFLVMCGEYSDGDGDFVEIKPSEWRITKDNAKYQTFELRENLQNLYKETFKLMVKGFIEKIIGDSLEKDISILAKNYRKEWKEKLCESVDIEEYGLNEYLGGKAEAYEDCLKLIKQY